MLNAERIWATKHLLQNELVLLQKQAKINNEEIHYLKKSLQSKDKQVTKKQQVIEKLQRNEKVLTRYSKIKEEDRIDELDFTLQILNTELVKSRDRAIVYNHQMILMEKHFKSKRACYA